MNANQLINMVVRMVMRQVVGRGLNAGIDAASRKMSKNRDGDAPQGRASPENGEMANRAKQSRKVTRRLGRF